MTKNVMVVRHGSQVLAVIDEMACGLATCAPDDTFDLTTGIQLALLQVAVNTWSPHAFLVQSKTELPPSEHVLFFTITVDFDQVIMYAMEYIACVIADSAFCRGSDGYYPVPSRAARKLQVARQIDIEGAGL